MHRLRSDSHVVDRPGWYQVTTPSEPSGRLNEVLWADPEDAGIAEVLASYAALGVSCKWCVWPWSRPGLAEALAARASTSWWARGMSLPTRTPLHSDLRATQIGTDRLDEAAQVAADGWGEPVAAMRDDLETLLSLPDGRLFLAEHDGAAIGLAATRDKPEGGYLTGAVVLQAHRGRGAYRALLAARLADLRARGIRLATTHAREATSAPILERLGFRTEFRYQIFQFDPGGAPRCP
jgi:hypothetical protein